MFTRLSWWLLASASVVFLPLGHCQRLHQLRPRDSHEFQRIIELARAGNWDIWFASPFATEFEGGLLRVEGQMPFHGLNALESGGRIDIYDPSSSGHSMLESLKVPELVEHSVISIPTRIVGASEYPYFPVDTPYNSTFHTSYHTLPSILQFLRELEEQFGSLMTMRRIGLSTEGRDLLAVEISKKETHSNKKPRAKRSFVIGGAQHAREWIATSAVLHVIHSLVHPEGVLNPLLDYFSFYILPLPNPDGYVWTWEGDRFWYKNRQNLGEGIKCVGVDTNRNWGYKWRAQADQGSPYAWRNNTADMAYEVPSEDVDSNASEEEGEETRYDLNSGNEYGFQSHEFAAMGDSSDVSDDDSPHASETETFYSGRPKLPTDPCSHWFPGSRKWQAPEVNDYANWVTSIPSLSAFLDLRSYGQMVSTPYSFSCDKVAKDAEDLMEAALGATSAMKMSGGATYTTGSLCRQLYPAPGNIIDWMYKVRGVKFAYSVHLRDTGTYGFALPASYILPVSAEVEEMVKSLSRFILERE